MAETHNTLYYIGNCISRIFMAEIAPKYVHTVAREIADTYTIHAEQGIVAVHAHLKALSDKCETGEYAAKKRG